MISVYAEIASVGIENSTAGEAIFVSTPRVFGDLQKIPRRFLDLNRIMGHLNLSI